MSDPYSALRDDYDKTWELLEAARAELAETQSALTAAEAMREACMKAVCRHCENGREYREFTERDGSTFMAHDLPMTVARCAAECIRTLPTPTDALQRVREEARLEGAERLRARLHALASANCQGRCVTLPSEVDREFAALFPKPGEGVKSE